jgi:hypothetical protein
MKRILFVLLALLSLTACEVDAEYDQQLKTQKLMAESNAQVGMPAIVNFQERRMAKQILEMRDQKISTHTYIMNVYRGCLVYMGQSIGFGLPYSVQFTNPAKYEANGATLPQADPNGLYMPESSQATWVLLYNPETKTADPTYVEENVFVSTFRLKSRECL